MKQVATCNSARGPVLTHHDHVLDVSLVERDDLLDLRDVLARRRLRKPRFEEGFSVMPEFRPNAFFLANTLGPRV